MRADPFAARRPFTAEMPRQVIEAEIERLIAILDLQDGDPDKEPSLGWSDDIRTMSLNQPLDDCEEDDDAEASSFNEVRAWRGAFEMEPRFLRARKYRHDRDYLGVSAEGRA